MPMRGLGGAEKENHAIDNQTVILPHRRVRVLQPYGNGNKSGQLRVCQINGSLVGRKWCDSEAVRSKQEGRARHMKGAGHQQDGVDARSVRHRAGFIFGREDDGCNDYAVWRYPVADGGLP